MTRVAISFGCAWQRNASVLLWTPVLLLGPVLDLHGSGARVAVQAGLIVLIAAAAVGAVLTSRVSDQGWHPYVALGVLAAATAGGIPQGAQWLPTWGLVALTVPSVLRRWWLAGALLAVTAASMAAAWSVEPSEQRLWTQGFVVLLAGAANTAVVRLIETIEELRRTREELASRAVAEERERFSQDLHDLLGHTLSVMVVKAQAVRRLAERDPAAAAEHAADIERVGRDALTEVREAVDATRALSLEDELEGARRALDAAGIRAEVGRYERPLSPEADRMLAWVVREGVTNVLRHSGAASCRFELDNGDGHATLTVSDDGVGGPAVPHDRQGGLDGLRRRLSAAGGVLDVRPGEDGFRLTARIPQKTQGER